MKVPRAYAVAEAEWLGKHLVIHTDTAPEWLKDGPDCCVMPKKSWERVKKETIVLVLLNVFWFLNWLVPHAVNLFKHHSW